MQVPPFSNFTQTEFDLFHVEYAFITTVTVGFTQYPVNIYTIDNVLNGTQYTVHVAVNNSAGLGDYSFPPVVTNTPGLGMSWLCTVDAKIIIVNCGWYEIVILVILDCLHFVDYFTLDAEL